MVRSGRSVILFGMKWSVTKWTWYEVSRNHIKQGVELRTPHVKLHDINSNPPFIAHFI